MSGPNSNVKYPIIDKYVSVPDYNNASALMLKTDYQQLEVKIKGLRETSRETLSAIRLHETGKNRNNSAEHPLNKMTPQQKESFLKDMEEHGLSCGDQRVKDVHADLRGGKSGYKTPVYNVNGHPVIGLHFDEEGNLAKGVAKVFAPETLPQPAARFPKPPGGPR